MKMTSLLQIVDKLHEASKINNTQQVSGCVSSLGCVDTGGLLKTHKLLQTCSRLFSMLVQPCYPVVFVLVAPSWLTTYYKVVELDKLVTSCRKNFVATCGKDNSLLTSL